MKLERIDISIPANDVATDQFIVDKAMKMIRDVALHIREMGVEVDPIAQIGLQEQLDTQDRIITVHFKEKS